VNTKIKTFSIAFFLILTSSFSQVDDYLYIDFKINESQNIIKKWSFDKDFEKFTIINKQNDSVVFISNKESYIKNKKVKKNLIEFNYNFDFNFIDFFKILENKKVIIILNDNKKYRYIIINEIIQYQREQS